MAGIVDQTVRTPRRAQSGNALAAPMFQNRRLAVTTGPISVKEKGRPNHQAAPLTHTNLTHQNLT
jgi:hypothetical protein